MNRGLGRQRRHLHGLISLQTKLLPFSLTAPLHFLEHKADAEVDSHNVGHVLEIHILSIPPRLGSTFSSGHVGEWVDGSLSAPVSKCLSLDAHLLPGFSGHPNAGEV